MSELWQACAAWVMLALAKDDNNELTPLEEARAIANGTAAMIDAGAYLHGGKVMFPKGQ
ncbi:hypothetical protein ACWPM1_07635 [Tsuneonella sp. HG249]